MLLYLDSKYLKDRIRDFCKSSFSWIMALITYSHRIITGFFAGLYSELNFKKVPFDKAMLLTSHFFIFFTRVGRMKKFFLNVDFML